MRITKERLDYLTGLFADEAINRLTDFSKGLKPDPDVEPVSEIWRGNALHTIFRMTMAETLLSMVTVEPPAKQ